MMAVVHDDAFDVFPLREDYRCTPQSVASHTLYENADPFDQGASLAHLTRARRATRRFPSARCGFGGLALHPGPRIHGQARRSAPGGYSTILMGGCATRSSLPGSTTG
jgi:hypothetical protein